MTMLAGSGAIWSAGSAASSPPCKALKTSKVCRAHRHPSAYRRSRRNVEHLGFGKWRLTFDLENGDIRNLDLEDYH
jgi:hypothetical protein